MERVLFNLHAKSSSFVLRHSSARTRSLVEHGVLLVAVCGFGVLILSHLSFVYRGAPGDEASSASSSPSLAVLGIPRPQAVRGQGIPLSCLPSIPGFREDADVTHIVLADETEMTCTQQTEASTCSSDVFLSYSKRKGFLLLSPYECARHNITTQFLVVSKTNPTCFGEPFLQKIVLYILGPDTVVINWLLALHDGHGYIYNPRTMDITDLINDDTSDVRFQRSHFEQFLFKTGVLLTSLFLFYITTTLVSFTLRETQDRMLQFTFALQAHVRAGLPHGQLVLQHVVENLVFCPIMVGMMFFLIEFYRGDKFLAFMVLSIVWVCEVFSVISMRTKPGMDFFPRVFFLLFTLFHVYFFSCPFGFSYTALASTACFMMHSMLFFWNRYELPAVAHGLVSMDHFRMDSSSSLQNHTTTNARRTTVLAEDPPELPRSPLEFPQHQPPATLTRRHASDTSFPSVSSSLGGRFGAGDDDESYMYFMDGEVVMHRRVQPSPFASPSGSLRHLSTGSIGEATTDSDNHVPVSTVPQHIFRDPLGGLASTPVSDDRESSSSITSEHATPRRRTTAASGGVQPQAASSLSAELEGDDDDDPPQGLLSSPSTLEGVDGDSATPRARGTTTSRRDEAAAQENGAQVPSSTDAPAFPFFFFGRPR